VSSSRKPSEKPSRARGKAPRARASAGPAAKAAAPPEPKPAPPPPRRGIRLGGSPASRLTIKPSPQQGPRPQLELSTKVRPSGPRPLSEVELDEDEVLVDSFEATLDGERVRITAVLERTCVYVHKAGDRRLARKEDLLVEADKLPIRRRGLG
jgi:hypothetical protein